MHFPTCKFNPVGVMVACSAITAGRILLFLRSLCHLETNGHSGWVLFLLRRSQFKSESVFFCLFSWSIFFLVLLHPGVTCQRPPHIREMREGLGWCNAITHSMLSTQHLALGKPRTTRSHPIAAHTLSDCPAENVYTVDTATKVGSIRRRRNCKSRSVGC
ncbi:hypothetical protein B0T25DRAFT_63794 [Lasiosphaeria hispida]|uniref:Uncharacterized protein n=1 Tax=Lasiosphaeria hispida TaxID=260671 RepID=A0AAJ0HXG5_9PEZI|nr:hypothetical protein B0T25DRAFT_63794 [Lasiosphaeria hispida]